MGISLHFLHSFYLGLISPFSSEYFSRRSSHFGVARSLMPSKIEANTILASPMGISGSQLRPISKDSISIWMNFAPSGKSFQAPVWNSSLRTHGDQQICFSKCLNPQTVSVYPDSSKVKRMVFFYTASS